MLELLISYVIRFLPGVVLGGCLLFLIPKKQTGIRILIYILLFVLTRDTMTPMGLWSFGTDGFFWLRFINDPLLVVFLGIMSAGIVFAINLLEKELKMLLIWHKGNILNTILSGIIGALIVVMPLFIIYLSVPIGSRGGKLPMYMVIPIFIISLLGNFYEEVLFRGYFQGYIEKWINPIKAAFLSGILFGFGHSFLAITVTDIGWPLLVFATYEGIIAGLIRMKYGLLGATVTHGLAIFLLAVGII